MFTTGTHTYSFRSFFLFFFFFFQNKVSLLQFVQIRDQVNEHLRVARCPPDILADLLEVSFDSVSLIINVSREGKAAVIVKKRGAAPPTSENFLRLTQTNEPPPKTVGFSIVDTTADDDVAVEITHLKPSTDYDAYSYAQHPFGNPSPNSEKSIPSGSTNEDILLQLVKFSTTKPPEPDIVVPWAEMDPEEQTTELLAVIKDKRVKAIAKEQMIIVPVSSDADSSDEHANGRWVNFHRWWAYEVKARRDFCLREMTFAAKNSEIANDAASDGVTIMEGDWNSVRPSHYDAKTHQFDNIENQERWLRWRGFCLWYRGYDGDQEIESSSSEEEESSSDEEVEVENGDGDGDVVEQEVIKEAKEEKESLMEEQEEKKKQDETRQVIDANSVEEHAVARPLSTDIEAAESALLTKIENRPHLNSSSVGPPQAPKPPVILPSPSITMQTNDATVKAAEKKSFITNKLIQVSDSSHKVNKVASAIVEDTPESALASASKLASDEKDVRNIDVKYAQAAEDEEEVEDDVQDVQQDVQDAQEDVEGSEDKKVDDVLPISREPTITDDTVVEAKAEKAPPKKQPLAEIDPTAAVDDGGKMTADATTPTPASDNVKDERTTVAPSPSATQESKEVSGADDTLQNEPPNIPATSMFTVAKAKKKLKKGGKNKKKKDKEESKKKLGRTVARAKFLGKRTSQVNTAISKVTSMIEVTDDFEAREKGLKPKLKGIALLRAKTKALMMSRKLAQLKSNLKNASSGVSAEDIADVDLFEEVDMSKFEPDPVDERPPTPPPPTCPFFTFWKSMSEEERLCELKLACMDLDVLKFAVECKVIPPDLEDSDASFPKRKQAWDAFRLWYSNNEEIVEGSDEKAAAKKKDPEIAAARKIFGRNEAAASLRDSKVMSSGFKGKAVGDGGGAPTIEYRIWYNGNVHVRREFLVRTAKRLEIIRRSTVALRTYSLPEPPLLQEVLDPAMEGPPPVEHRVRLYGSRYPETFTWEEVSQWFSFEEASDDDLRMKEAEEAANAERRRLKLLKTEREREELERKILMWEDHRSCLMRIAMKEMTEETHLFGSEDDYLNESYGHFDALPSDKKVYEGLRNLGYDTGTGLDNLDEFSDDRERAAAEAAARARRREERARREASEKKRLEAEERKRKMDEERTRRIRETAAERARIVKELAEIKQGRIAAKLEKERAEKEAAENADRDEKRKAALRENEKRQALKKQQAIDDAKRWKEQREKEIERDREVEEGRLMLAEDVASGIVNEQYIKRQAEIKQRRELLEFAYLRPSDYKDEDQFATKLLWSGPKSFRTKTRRRFHDTYSMPTSEHILEEPLVEPIEMNKGISSKFLQKMGLSAKFARTASGSGTLRSNSREAAFSSRPNTVTGAGGGSKGARYLKKAKLRSGGSEEAAATIKTSPMIAPLSIMSPGSPESIPEFNLTVASAATLSPIRRRNRKKKPVTTRKMEMEPENAEGPFINPNLLGTSLVGSSIKR